MQLPLMHVWPAVQRRPHAPQLLGSVLVSVLPMHRPSLQAPLRHVRVIVPQVPHVTCIVLPVVHVMQLPVASHAQAALHVRSRNCPEGQPVVVVECVPGAHSPSPPQAPAGTQLQLVSQWAVCVPQLPQLVEPTSPGMHSPSFMQTP